MRKTRGFRRIATPRRPVRRNRWYLEALEDRTLLATVPGSDISNAITLMTPSDMRTDEVGPGSPVFYEIDPQTDSLLVASVHDMSGYTRLLLLESQGQNQAQLVVQSDGQSATNRDDRIEQHLPAGRDYLEVQSLGGIATFALSVDLIASSEPYQPAPAIPYTQVVAFGAFSKTSLLDFAQSDGVHANAGDGTFSEPTMSLPISAQLSGDTLGPMVAGSFGGNGGDDLAVLATDDSGDIFVEVLRNDGTGNFTEQPVIWLPDLYGGGNSLPILVAGHFTSGSYDDLAVAGEGPDGGAAVQLVLMQHDKSFQPGAIIPAGAPDTDLVTAHLTGRHDSNGRLLDDLVVASLYVTQIQVLDNEGGGQFERGQTIMPGVSPESVAAGRFTTQGQALDGLAIVGVSQSSGLRGAIVAEVLTNNGSGQLEVESPITLDLNNLINGSPEIVAANFSGNPDGVDDLAVASQDVSGSNRVDILLNTGSADFQAASTVALGDVNESVLVKGNFTGSGRVDLAAYGVDPAGNGHVDVFAGRGDGTFAGLTSGAPAPLANDPYQTQTVFDNPSKAVSGRFTIDGHLDLAVPVKTLAPGGTFDNTYDNSIEVFLGNGDGTFRAAPSIDLGDLTPMALAVGHFSGDQFDDIAVAAQDPTTSVNLIELLTSNGDGTFRATAAVFLSDFGYVGNLVSGKFSGGSVDDLAVAGLASDGSSIAEVVSRLSDGSFRPGPEIALGSLQLSSLEPFSMAVGHFTSSARDDFVVAGPGQDASGLFQYQVVDVSMVAPGTFLSGPVTPLGDLSPNIVGAASFSSNIGGLDDLAVAGGTFDSLNVQILFNHGGDGTFTPAQSIDLNGLFPAAIAAGPLFGPDESDLAVAGVDQSGNLSVVTLQNDGTGNFPTESSVTFGQDTPLSLILGDFTGDGNSDLLLTTLNNAVMLLRGDGDGTFDSGTKVGAPFLSFPVPIQTGLGLATTADFNGDGRLDVAAAVEGAGAAPEGSVVVQHDANVVVQLGNGDGTFVEQFPGVDPTTGMGVPLDLGVFAPIDIVAGDFNGNGFEDLAALGFGPAGDAEIRVLQNDGGGPVLVAQLPAGSSGPPAVPAPVGGASQSVRFQLDPSIDLGDFEAVGMVAADFSGDGRDDIAVTGYFQAGHAAVVVLRGNRDGTFTIEHAIDLGNVTLHSLVAADFDNDGRPDLAVGVSRAGGQGGVDLLLGNGDGTFRAPQYVGLGSLIPVDLVAGNFASGPHPTDIAIAGQDGMTGRINVAVLSGNGAGTIVRTSAPDFGTGFLEGLLASDFNRDGQGDLALVTGGRPSQVEVLLGIGNGSFRSTQPSAFTELAVPTVAGDFNRDGATDLALVTGASTVQTEISKGDGTFSIAGASPDAFHKPPIVADPGDGSSDLFVVDQSGNILWRKGEPNSPLAFAPPAAINPGFPSRGIAFVPIRGRSLIASIDLEQNAISLYVYSGGQFIRGASLPTGAFPTELITADLTGKGNLDLVVLDSGDGAAAVYLGDGNGGFARESDVPIGFGASDITAASLDPGAPMSLIVTNRDTGDVRIFPGKGNGTFLGVAVYQAGAGPYALAADGTTDLVSLEATAGVAAGTFTLGGSTGIAVINPGSNSLAVLEGLGGGALANERTSFTIAPASAVVSGDFNGDGVSDLAVLEPDGVNVYLGDGHGGFGKPTPYPAGTDPTGLGVADLNGHTDLLASDGYGDVIELLGDGTGRFMTPNLNQQIALAVADTGPGGQKTFAFAEQGNSVVSAQAGVTAQPQPLAGPTDGIGILDPGAVALADMNGEGLPDLIVANSGANDVLIYLGVAGGGYQQQPLTFPVGNDPVSITVADLTGDGIPDLVVANKGSNDISVLLGEGQGADWTMQPFERLAAGIGPTSTAVVNASGNGIPDILVSDSGSNDVRLIKGVGGGFFNDSQPTVFPTGSSPQQVIVGPFTGQPGQLDMVTLNAGSNNLTEFLDFNGGNVVPQTIPSGGETPVAAVEGDFGGGATGLLVANNGDGQLALFVGGGGGLHFESSFQEPGLANPTGLAIDGSGAIFGASEGVPAAVAVVLGLGSGGVELSSGQPELQVALLQPLTQTSLALVATLLSVTGDEPELSEAGPATAALANQSLTIGTEAAPTNEGVGQGETSALESLLTILGQPIAAELSRFVGGMENALQKFRRSAEKGRLFAAPQERTKGANPAGPPAAQQSGQAEPAVRVPAADLNDANGSTGFIDDGARPATANNERPPAAALAPPPQASAEKSSPAQAPLLAGGFSIGLVSLTLAFVDLVLAHCHATRAVHKDRPQRRLQRRGRAGDA